MISNLKNLVLGHPGGLVLMFLFVVLLYLCPQIIAATVVVIPFAGAILLWAHVALSESKKDELRKVVERWRARVAAATPEDILLGHLELLSGGYNQLFSGRWSRIAFKRSWVASNLLLLLMLIIINIVDKTGGLKPAPWEYFDTSMTMLKDDSKWKTFASVEKTNATQALLEFHKGLQRRRMWLTAHDSVGWKVGYSVAYFVFLFITNGCLGFFSFAVSRATLEEMLRARRLIPLLSTWLLNLCAASLTIIVALSWFVLAIPFIWPMLLSLPPLAVAISLLIVIAVAIPLLLLLGGPFARAIWMPATFPYVLLGLVVFPTLLCFLFKNRIHNSAKTFLLRWSEWRQGPLAFIASVLTVFVALVGCVARLPGTSVIVALCLVAICTLAAAGQKLRRKAASILQTEHSQQQ